MKRTVEDINLLLNVGTGIYNHAKLNYMKELADYLEGYTSEDIEKIDRLVDEAIEKEIEFLKECKNEISNKKSVLILDEFSIYRLNLAKDIVRKIVEINENPNIEEKHNVKFSKKLINILDNNLGKEKVLEYYDKLVDKWHTSPDDNGSLKKYLGLSNEIYQLFLMDTDEFISAIEHEFLVFKEYIK